MAKSIAQLTEQMHRIQRQIEAAKAKEVAGVVARIQEAIAHYGLTSEDIFPPSGRQRLPKATKSPKPKNVRETKRPPAQEKKSKTAGVKLPPKFSDGAGSSWSGRGSTPRWLVDAIAGGKTKEDFAVSP